MNKQVKKITYIAVATLILSLSMTPMLSIVAAKNEEKQARITFEDQINLNLVILNGYGIATDKQDEQAYRSHIKLAGEVITNNEDTNNSKRFQVLKGTIVIINNGTRIKYSIINETWTGTFGKGKFIANGAIQDEEGNKFRVHLKGDVIRRNNGVVQMLVEGELNGDGESFKLQYITITKHILPRFPMYR